jgi:hypothetical protein
VESYYRKFNTVLSFWKGNIGKVDSPGSRGYIFLYRPGPYMPSRAGKYFQGE